MLPTFHLLCYDTFKLRNTKEAHSASNPYVSGLSETPATADHPS